MKGALVSQTVANSFVYAGLPRRLPSGYGAAPVFAGESGAVRLCVVVRTGAKAGEGPFVLLRETIDARVYLGCIADAGQRVHSWVEVWVQDTAGLGQAIASYRQAVNNRVLDERWILRCELLDAADGHGGAGGGELIRTGFERTNPAPVLIDVKRMAAVPAKDRQNATWGLCKDEGVLAKKGLPGYQATLSRHLYQVELGEQGNIIPVEMADGASLGLGPEVAALNGGGGMMMVQPYCPLGYEQLVDAVTGVEGEGGPSDALLGGIAAAARGGDGLTPGAGWLGLSAKTPSARVVESLHVKLLLLSQAVHAVRSHVAATQAPMLNVTGRSFRVRLGDDGGVLPLWWTSRVSLVEPGEGVELAIPGTSAKYFIAGRGGGLSMYSPAAVSQAGSGRGWLRLRNVVAEDAGGLVLEATLSTQDRVIPGRNDLVWLRLALGASRLDLYATVDAKGSMAPGEVRLRTIPQKFGEDVAGRIKSALGVPVPDVTFEILPLLSSPCDLYALGVLAVRTLLVGKGTPLPVALDELLSLAGVVAKDAAGGDELMVRLERVYGGERRWKESLGPQALLADASAEDASGAIPPELWLGVLAATIRCFTGLSPDSRCRDFGDAPPGGLHKVFDGVLDDLYALLTACRTLIVSDYALNSEVRAVVQSCIASNR